MNTDGTMCCPNCGEPMVRMYYVVGGGIWGSESKFAMENYGVTLSSPEEEEQLEHVRRQFPLHCIIGSSGYSSRNEQWPKEGWFCKSNAQCLTMIIKPMPR